MSHHRIGLALASAFITAAAHAAPVTQTNSTFGTFDASGGTRTFTFSDVGTVSNVNLAIDFAKCDDPALSVGGTNCASNGEEYAGETYFFLTNPLGVRVDLVYTYSDARPNGTYDRQVSSGGRYLVAFSDSATGLVGPVLRSGSFRPEQSFSAFTGQSGDGLWTLTVGDSAGGDPLSFFSATLGLVGANAVPEPAPIALGLVGIVAWLASRRRRRAHVA